SILERIVGGQTANISEVPWQASLEILGEHQCGAVIFSDQIVITAAHCVTYFNKPRFDDYVIEMYSVRVGSSRASQGGQVVKVAGIIRHDNYTSNCILTSNDIAVIRLKTRIQLGDSVRPIPLADGAPSGGTPALVSGWGSIQNLGWTQENLRKVTVNIVDWNDCGMSYKYITEDQICAAALGKDSCQGDSGGPLVVNGKLVGIVSYGNGCAHPYYPGVYANVALLRPWIENAINFQGGQVVKVAGIIRHEKYQGPCNVYYDIAVIRLKTRLQLGGTVRPIPLAYRAPRVGAPALVSGWGDIEYKGKSSEILLKVTLNIVDRNDCGKSYKSYISEDKICAAAPGKGSCQGDSGGPLVVDGELVGIVSYGVECAHPYYPGIYANVAVLRPWIENAINL
ncbi:hypothetical protein KR084_007787, partial [Drosophila pseudotakahashii]